ncbi:MAG: 1,4-alpha-glucan branching protein [Clostridiales bacterium]|jgi:hypothetical protein|nr:1,4-alpha-glucan branching protein [Clostridiales bacterium]
MNRIKDAFSAIRAEDALKAGTTRFMQAEIQKASAKKRPAGKRIAFASAAFAVLFFFGALSYISYFTPTAFLDFDINPSIELSVNRFGSVIEAHAYNREGEQILSEANLKYKTYQDATRLIVDAAVGGGYLRDEAMISVTLQTDNIDEENQMLISVESSMAAAVSEHHIAPRAEVFPVSAEVRIEARGQDVSPAKYLAILALQKVDPAATVDSCRDHSIGEIRGLTREHHGGAGEIESGGRQASGGPDSDMGHHGGGHHEAITLP